MGPVVPGRVHSLLASATIRTQCAQIRVYFVTDPKTSHNAGARPYKVLPDLNTKEFIGFIMALFGDPEMPIERRAGAMVFSRKGSSDMLLAFDARKAGNAHKITTEARKAFKGLPNFFKNSLPVCIRLVYTNLEFQNAPGGGQKSGPLKREGRDALRCGTPEPLETLHLVFCKDAKTPLRALTLMDTPGDNRTHLLNVAS